VRFFFEPPRRPKTKPGPNIKSLLVRCPSTSKLTDTGQTVEEKRWAKAKVKNQKFMCAYCGTMHAWTKKDVILGRPMRVSR
jgi:aspartate carbamoyltransferase regulatory subunit